MLQIDLLVAEPVATQLRTARQQHFGVERGGLLFVDLEDPRGLVLIQATPPHSLDNGTSHSLNLDRNRCREEITQANARGWRLIGVWHSHPQDTPSPSGQDIHSFRELGRRSAGAIAWPLAVIVGRSPENKGIGAWSVRKREILQAQWVQTPAKLGNG